MRVFSGFPAGKLQVTPLPNLFFSEVCPAISDLAELKLTLHLFWLFGNKPRRLHVTAAELRGDRTLMDSLQATGGDPAAALERALALAAERGTLLEWRAEADGQAPEPIYFLNSEAGRRALEKMKRGGGPTGTAQPPEESAGARPNIFTLYERNIGLLTPLIVDELKAAEQDYPAEWIEEAFRISVENNKRSWSYARTILERWQSEGRASPAQRGKPWYGDEYGKYVKR